MILPYLGLVAASALAVLVRRAVRGLVGQRAVWRRGSSDRDLPMASARRRR